MKLNMGSLDRIIRVLIAICIAYLIFAGRIGGAFAIVLGIVAIVFILTAIFARCPIYSLWGLSTCKCCDKSGSDDNKQPPVAPA